MRGKVEEIKIAGYTIRPWTVSTRVSVSPEFREISRIMAAEGIEADDILHQGPEISNLFLPPAISIIAKSLAISTEEVERIPWPSFLEILTTIVKINRLGEEKGRLQ